MCSTNNFLADQSTGKKMREGWGLKDKVFCPFPPPPFPQSASGVPFIRTTKETRTQFFNKLHHTLLLIHQLNKMRRKYNSTIAGHVNPENQFNLEKRGPCTPDQCYGDAFGVLKPATVYKR